MTTSFPVVRAYLVTAPGLQCLIAAAAAAAAPLGPLAPAETAARPH